MTSSPFRAGFGKVPPALAGRSEVVAAFEAAIEPGNWSAERALLIRGFRGVGKTVLAERLRRSAEDRGWVTVDELAAPGFLGRMENKLRTELRRLDPDGRVRISGITTPLGGVDVEYVDGAPIRQTVETLTHALASLLEPHAGVLFVLDEVNDATLNEFRDLVGMLQRLVSRDREVAVIVAGLHSDIAAILRDGTSTFLRRAEPVNLDLLDWESTLIALEQPIVDHGRRIDADALEYAARGTQGYPFLTQLIGDLAWKRRPDRDAITLDDARSAVRRSKRKMGSNIHEPSLSKLTALERSVLAAMAIDDGPSRVGELRERVGGVSRQHLNNIRIRLLDAGIVYVAARGKLDFSLPYLRDYLREHTVTDAMSTTSADIAAARARFPPPPDDA